jgi:hypothetical protein
MDQRTTHQIVTQTVGKTTFTWNERNPLEFEAVTRYAVGDPEYGQRFDLAQLTVGFEASFLLGPQRPDHAAASEGQSDYHEG